MSLKHIPATLAKMTDERPPVFLDTYNKQVRTDYTSSVLADGGGGFHNNGFILVEVNTNERTDND